jgi:UDP-glucose 4-epimerase
MMSDKLSFQKTLRWLVTGGCGFIGTALISRLMSEGGHHIRVLDNLLVGTREDLARVCKFAEVTSLFTSHTSVSDSSNDSPSNLQCELIVGDITDAQTCIACAEDADVIVHLAANTGVGPSVEDPRKDMEANVIGTFNMLESARLRKVSRFVFASSGAPVGECEPPIHEEMAAHPVSPYGASKLAGEGYCSAYHRTFGLETVALRFGNVYGPGSSHKNSVIAKFIKQALNGKALEIYGDGSQTRDFIYIDDLIEAIYKAATLQNHSVLSLPLPSGIHDSEEPSAFHQSPQPSTHTHEESSVLKRPQTTESSSHILSLASGVLAGEVFQIATHSETTVGELAELLINVLGAMDIRRVELIHGEPRKGDVRRNYSDTTKAFKCLGWTSQTKLKRGLEQTLRWFLLNSDLPKNQ